MWHHNNSLVGILTVHVDNFLRVGTVFFVVVVVFGGFFWFFFFSFKNVISKLRGTFSVGKEEDCIFRYLGRNIISYQEQLTIDQNKVK